jgi:hypothetical protein
MHFDLGVAASCGRFPFVGAHCSSCDGIQYPLHLPAFGNADTPDERSDWERRVLAATRWLSRVLRTSWPADRLAGTVVALECLFVAGMCEPDRKGARIAARLSERFKLNELTAEEQVKWLEGLYKARNAAVHEGREFVHDLEVDRLTELATSDTHVAHSMKR